MSRARRGIALILLAAHVAGCSSWQAVGGVGAADRVRVTRLSGEQVELSQPIVRGDTIVAGSIAIPRSEIAQVEARRFSAGRTLALIVSFPVILIGIVAVGYATCDRCGDFTGAGH